MFLIFQQIFSTAAEWREKFLLLSPQVYLRNIIQNLPRTSKISINLLDNAGLFCNLDLQAFYKLIEDTVMETAVHTKEESTAARMAVGKIKELLQCWCESLQKRTPLHLVYTSSLKYVEHSLLFIICIRISDVQATLAKLNSSLFEDFFLKSVPILMLVEDIPPFTFSDLLGLPMAPPDAIQVFHAACDSILHDGATSSKYPLASLLHYPDVRNFQSTLFTSIVSPC